MNRKQRISIPSMRYYGSGTTEEGESGIMKGIRISSMLSLALIVILCIELTACGGTSDMGSD